MKIHCPTTYTQQIYVREGASHPNTNIRKLKTFHMAIIQALPHHTPHIQKIQKFTNHQM